jgi:hypothetical protein
VFLVSSGHEGMLILSKAFTTSIGMVFCASMWILRLIFLFHVILWYMFLIPFMCCITFVYLCMLNIFASWSEANLIIVYNTFKQFIEFSLQVCEIFALMNNIS